MTPSTILNKLAWTCPRLPLALAPVSEKDPERRCVLLALLDCRGADVEEEIDVFREREESIETGLGFFTTFFGPVFAPEEEPEVLECATWDVMIDGKGDAFPVLDTFTPDAETVLCRGVLAGNDERL